MDLTVLQREAFDIAEVKGLHDGLACIPLTDPRNIALAALANVFASVTDLAQTIKRHGINQQAIMDEIDGISINLDAFRATIRGEARFSAFEPLTATAVRLTLIHTEVSEAYDVAEQSLPAFMAELADIVIRVADQAQCISGDLDTAVQAKLALNRTRPYQYGTPGEDAG